MTVVCWTLYIFVINLNQKLIIVLNRLQEIMLAHTFRRIIKNSSFTQQNYRNISRVCQIPRYQFFFKKPSEKTQSNFEKINANKDYYKILNLKESANSEQIKQAYYKLAKQYHPDHNTEKNAMNKFKDINQAYQVLNDENLRTYYDDIKNPQQNEEEFEKKFQEKFKNMTEEQKSKFRKKALVGSFFILIGGLAIIGLFLYALFKLAKKWFSSSKVPAIQQNLRLFQSIDSDRLQIKQEYSTQNFSSLPYGYAPYKLINFYSQTPLQRYFTSMNIDYDPKIFTSVYIDQLYSEENQSKTKQQ